MEKNIYKSATAFYDTVKSYLRNEITKFDTLYSEYEKTYERLCEIANDGERRSIFPRLV